MDPITAMILAMAIAGITSRFIGGGVAEAAAAIKGKPSPAAQKWQAREQARKAQGEHAEHKPGLFRVLWDNAIEERTQKAAARHVGRMEALREMAGAEQAKAREKLLRQAQRRAAVAEKVASWGNQSRGFARRVAEDTASVITERRAENVARRSKDPAVNLDAPAPENTEDDAADDEGVVHEPVEGEAEVIPFRRKTSAAQALAQEIADHRAEAARVADAAGTNTAPTPQMYSDWRKAQGRQSPTEAELRARFGAATEEDIRQTQIRGSFRVIPEWRDANVTWQLWHEGKFSTRDRDNQLLEGSGIDPHLAVKLHLSAAELSPYAGRANACLESNEVYTPPSEAELWEKFGHRATDDWVRYVDTAAAAGIEPVVAERLGMPQADLDAYARMAREYFNPPPSEDELAKRYAVEEQDRPPVMPPPDFDGEIICEPVAPPQDVILRDRFRAMFGDDWLGCNYAGIWEDWQQGRISMEERNDRLARVASLDPLFGMGEHEPHDNELYQSWKWAVGFGQAQRFWRQELAFEENGLENPEPENTDDEGNPEMTSATAQTTTVPEITDLATGIEYTTTIGRHFTDLGAKLADDADVVGNNAAGFDAQVGVIEAGQAALGGQGFGGVVQTAFDEVAETLPSSAAKLRQIQTLLTEVGEEITSAASSMQKAKVALEEQRGLAEHVQTQSSSNGVAKDTAFYQEA